MRTFVIRQNIERYRRLLDSETNESRRRMLARLLSEEEEIWARMTGSHTGRDPSRKPDPNA